MRFRIEYAIFIRCGFRMQFSLIDCDNLMQIDDLDRRILAQLQSDASLTNQALSERVFASAATTLRRVSALRNSGMIDRYVALLSPAAFAAIHAISEITLDEQHAEAFAVFEAIALAERCISQCYRTSPSVDFTLVLTLASMDDYNALVSRTFNMKNNVRNVRTRFSTARVKFETRLPL